jgi:hypothetical protein
VTSWRAAEHADMVGQYLVLGGHQVEYARAARKRRTESPDGHRPGHPDAARH